MFIALSLITYISAWAILSHNLYRGERFMPNAVMGVIALAAVFHGIELYQDMFDHDYVLLGVFNVLSLTSWVIICIVGLSALKKPLHNLFIGLIPLTIITLILSASFESPLTPVEHLTPGMITHILLSLLAYSLLAIATIQALVIAYQNKKLKSKHPLKVMGVLPPLQTMETLLFEIIWVGFILLTLSILSGFLFIDDFFVQKLSHKTLFSSISWIIYAILLGGHVTLGWRGKTALKWVLWGFAALVLAYIGSKLVIEIILNNP